MTRNTGCGSDIGVFIQIAGFAMNQPRPFVKNKSIQGKNS